MPSHWATAHDGFAVWLRVGLATPPHPYKPLGLLGGPYPCGWEAFPTPGALTHTWIIWALSPTAPQILGVTPGSLLCIWCFGHSS